MGIAENKKIVQEYHDLLSRGEVEKAITMMADEFNWFVVGSYPGAGHQNREQVAAALRGVTNALTGPLKFQIKQMTAEDDRVAVVATSEAQMKDGRFYKQSYHILYYVRDGKLHGGSPFLDTLAFAEQVYGAQVTYPKKSS